ncbi:Cell division protein ftsH homolog (ATP-dependent zinc-metallo protease) [Pseudorhizobium banfieldiae]|uniref:ATP-dependent zinc metalloprotease FtsH n=1 Tax=Pseudorhizobium banfieldiae TaxID=1125847 RepID=L0NDS4_9HYPH|nr:ATP-dependent zinc metalloprotease FtsH [Pseudorhizobium banfieldiae]CAD6602503.1 ATP-dependent zinc metalloprotease FtsH [arsenite-oxidising bacterium NT-25]CCF18467.1 Cell division protein ftsH homolog (ATP-dependent zinc-metallo protease) [Pseudorhizobium banfieldiae]
MNDNMKFNIWYGIAALFGVLLVQYFFAYSQQVTEIPYSQFETYLTEKRIAEVSISDNYVHGKFKQALPSGETMFVTTRVDPALVERLQESGAVYMGRIESNLLGNVLSWVLPITLFFGIWYFMMKRIGAGGGAGGLMQIGKSRAKVYVETDVKVTFDDVAGVDEAEDELKEIVDFLRDPEEYGRLGGRMPKGVLLVGPPGTGKTLIARAVAGEARVPFFSISGSEFVEMFVGVGAARVRDLFEQARAKAPAIIFIDELDALGRARGAGPMFGGHDEKEQTLNQLLVELDGFDPSLGVVLLAATNRPEILDPALLRAGRFDRQVLVDRPDKGGRIQILTLHMSKAKLAADVDPEQVAALTPGFTGADLANLVNEAALLATRRKADAVSMEDFNNAIERIVAGLEKRNRLLNPQERRIVAYHEMGHALVALSLPGVDPVHKVSIIPRGVGALGYTIQRPTEDRFLMTREELDDKMAVLLGGRAAEFIVFQHLSTGAADDLAKVTDIARAMVTRYGMSEKIGHIALESDQRSYLTPDPLMGGPRQHDYGEHTADAIDEEVRKIIDKAFDRAVRILTERRGALEDTARRLLEVETLGEDDLRPLQLQPPADDARKTRGGIALN